MKRKFSIALSIAIIMSFFLTAVVMADNLITDGDGLTPLNDISSINFGSVCLGSTTTRTIGHAISRNGNYPSTNVFLKGSVVTISKSSITGSGIGVTFNPLANTITIPEDWDTAANNTLSGYVTSTISFTANTLGSFSGSVEYIATGTSSKDGTSLVRSDSIAIYANVVSCDSTPPTLHLPGDMVVEATSSSGAVVTYTATADDTNPAHPTVTCAPSSGSTFGFGTTTVNCSATDAAGNTATGSFKVTVQDTTAPVLTLPDPIVQEAVGPTGNTITFTASASDTVDGTVAVSCNPPSGSLFGIMTTTVNCSATDAHSNTATGSFGVTVQDTTAPVIDPHGDITAEAAGPGGAVVSYTSPATHDVVDGDGTATCLPASGSTFPLGDSTVTCNATDAHGNAATSTTFTVRVVDTTPPEITYVDRTPANSFGWNNGAVTVNWSCTDLVGVVSSTVSVTVSTEGANLSATGTCEDTSGNTASNTENGINIDLTKPVASASRTPDPNAFGWNNTDVTVSFSGTDALSGIDSCSPDEILSAEGAGQSASGTCTDKAGNVSDPASVTNINIDKTAPTINGAPDRLPNANNWYNANVTVSFECDDSLSGVDFCTAPVTLGEGAAQSVPGLVTDKAGNSADTTVSGINIDKTAPEISAELDRLPAATGWFNIATGAPTVDFTCSDDLSGLDGACPASLTFGEGEDQAYSQTIYDLAGNSASAGVTNVDVDLTAPTISGSPDRLPNANGWYKADVIVTFTCDDTLSGLDFCTAPVTLGEGEAQSVDGLATDNAGNSATTSVGPINIDKTKPIVSLVGGPVNGASYYFGSVPAAPTCSASDALSGLDGTCGVSGYGATVGTHTVTASAVDKAGNSETASATYTVLAWTLKGFYQPVDMNGVYNVVKNGSTVPLKFEIFAGSTELTNTDAVASLGVVSVTCLAGSVEDAIETLATGGTVLRYDLTSGQFIFNWKTPSTAGKCYRVTMTAQDGSSLVAYFKLK